MTALTARIAVTVPSHGYGIGRELGPDPSSDPSSDPSPDPSPDPGHSPSRSPRPSQETERRLRETIAKQAREIQGRCRGDVGEI